MPRFRMDAASLLQRQGWRGSGHPLSQKGIARPLLVSKKVDVLGVGGNKHAAVSDQWWMRAYDQGLKDLGKGTKTALAEVREKGVQRGGLYARFVKGEGVPGTFQKEKRKREEEEGNGVVKKARKEKSKEKRGPLKTEKPDQEEKYLAEGKGRKRQSSRAEDGPLTHSPATDLSKQAKHEKRVQDDGTDDMEEDVTTGDSVESREPSKRHEAAKIDVDERSLSDEIPGFMIDETGDPSLHESTESERGSKAIVDKQGKLLYTYRPGQAVPLDPSIWQGAVVKNLPRAVRKARQQWMQQRRAERKAKRTGGVQITKQSRSERKVAEQEKLAYDILVQSRRAPNPELKVKIGAREGVPLVAVQTSSGPFGRDEMAAARSAARRVMKHEKAEKKAEQKAEKKAEKRKAHFMRRGSTGRTRGIQK